MAVYKRKFNPYQGERTPAWSRLLILPRYAYRDVFASRIVTAFFVACFFVPVVFAAMIYVRYNVQFLETVGMSPGDFFPIDANFFLNFLYFQGLFSFFLTILVGPGLVSPDLSHNALPLYLCRPFSRTEYILGKMAVLLILLSAITWVPGLILFVLQSSLAGSDWLLENWRIAPALFVGCWILIGTLGLVSMAVSAWVRWKLIAAATLFGVFFILLALGEFTNLALDVELGHMLNLILVYFTIWSWLFEVPTHDQLTLLEAWIALLGFCGLSLLVLNRKLRAYEVVS